MEDLKLLNKIVDAHAKSQSIYMNSGAVINFLDHISPAGDDCAECRQAVNNYQADCLVITRLTHPADNA